MCDPHVGHNVSTRGKYHTRQHTVSTRGQRHTRLYWTIQLTCHSGQASHAAGVLMITQCRGMTLDKAAQNNDMTDDDNVGGSFRKGRLLIGHLDPHARVIGRSVPAEADKGAPSSTQMVRASSHNNPSEVLVASPKLSQLAHSAIDRPYAKKGEAYQ